jgi:PAS domain S-box-containing protein
MNAMGDVSSGTDMKRILTDPERTTALLQESEEQLLCLVKTVSEGIAILDKTGKITFVNSTLEGLLGIDRNEIIGSNYIDPRWHIKPCGSNTSDDCDFIFGYIIRTGKSVSGMEHIWEISGGKRIMLSVNAAPYHDYNGCIAGVVAAMTDITERNEVKNEAKDIKEVYDRLTRYADEAIFRTEVESGRIIYINEAAERILGYSLNDYLSDPYIYTNSILPEYFPGWLDAMKEMERGKEAVRNMVMGMTAKDGRTVMMEFTAIAVRDEEGTITYFEALGRDITVRRFLEQELAKAQKLEAIGLLAGGIAHDFNNILTAVLGSLSLAKIETNPTGKLSERLMQAEEQCMRAKALTRRLLTYSRSGSPLRKTASLAQVLREATNFALSGKNVKSKFVLSEDLWPAQIDEGQMHQVVHYLVTNAAEAMPDGGTIEIGAQNFALGADQASPLREGSYVKWYVKDHGVGIPKEHMKKLFDPYFTTKQMGSVKGMGLGLAICYSIIKNHEGLINVESEPGAGTTFTVYIPALNEDSGEKILNRKGESKNTLKHKILLIDDEKILLDVTSSMLSHLGYEVATADCHEDALDCYAKAKENGRPYSLIIMDLTMRGNEGGETAIRKWLTIHPEVKAVISSGYSNDPVIEDYSSYGFVGAMVKPYTLVELKNTLAKLLAKNNI